MISVPMKQARRHSELTKHQKEPLADHFKECSLIIQKLQNNKKETKNEMAKEDYMVLFKTIANTNFYHSLSQKYGDSFSKASLKYLKFETYQKGEIIVKQGVSCLNTYFLLNGVIRLSKVQQQECDLGYQMLSNQIQQIKFQDMLSIGSSFGFLPREETISQSTYEVFSYGVELAVIDINSLRDIKTEAESQSNTEKIKFFQEQMKDLFEGVDKKTIQLFMQLIKEIQISRGELVTNKITQANQLCVISKGQIMSDYSVQVQHERVQDDGIDISNKREIKKRHYCTNILVRGDVFIINGNGEREKNIQGTHLKIKEKLVSTSFITQIYYLDDSEYEAILKKLRNDMRFEILVEDDNLKFSQKIINDFISMHQRFIQKQKDIRTQIQNSFSHKEEHIQNGKESSFLGEENQNTNRNNQQIYQNEFKEKLLLDPNNKRTGLNTSYQLSRYRRNTINVPSENIKSEKKNDIAYDVFHKGDLGKSAIQFYFAKQDFSENKRNRKASNNDFSLNYSAITENTISTYPNQNNSLIDSFLQTQYAQSARKRFIKTPNTGNQQLEQNYNVKENQSSKNPSRCEYMQSEPNEIFCFKRQFFPLSCKSSNIQQQQQQGLNQQMLNQIGQTGKQVQNLFQLQQQISSKRNRAVSQFIQNVSNDYGYSCPQIKDQHEDIQVNNQITKRRNTNNSISSQKKARNQTLELLTENSNKKKCYNLYEQFDDELENLLKCKNQILKKCKKDQKQFDRSSKQILKTYESTDIEYLSLKKKQILDQANKEIIKKRIEEKENNHKKTSKNSETHKIQLFGDLSDAIRARVSRIFKNRQNPICNSYV
ncbi:hypothetical protein ABPG72_000895 [Tetrahymena utriculariae]